jgi:disulfide bond formation protein DsbB
MTISHKLVLASRILNALGLLGVSSILYAAFAWQFVYQELPCPLCLLQRAAFILAGVGLLLNVRFGPSPLHYAMAIAASLAGMMASGRQILLHIGGGPGYGGTFMEWHLYTWAFVAFCVLIIFCVVMLAIDHRLGDHQQKQTVSALGMLIMVLFFVATLANVGMTTVECGFGPCPDNPSSYQWLGS